MVARTLRKSVHSSMPTLKGVEAGAVTRPSGSAVTTTILATPTQTLPQVAAAQAVRTAAPAAVVTSNRRVSLAGMVGTYASVTDEDAWSQFAAAFGILGTETEAEILGV